MLLVLLGGVPSCSNHIADSEGAVVEAAPQSQVSDDQAIGIRPEVQVTAFYLHPELEYLVPIERTIFETDLPIHRIKQLIEVLTVPPDPLEGLALWPSSTYVREVYLLTSNEVVVDIDSATFEQISAGTNRELFMIYSLVDTLYRNLEACSGVRILVDGRPRETLLGQVDIEHTLHERTSIVLEDNAAQEVVVEDLQ